MDHNKYFVDGQEIEGIFKKNDIIVEGSIFTKNDGTKVILQEGGRWLRLSDLKVIKRVGELLYESMVDKSRVDAEEIYKGLDLEEVDKKNKNDEVDEAVGERVLQMNDQVKKEDIDSYLPTVRSLVHAGQKAESSTGGDEDKLEAFKREFKNDLGNDLKESLRGPIESSLKKELGGMTYEEMWEEIDENDLPQLSTEKIKDIESDFDIEDLMLDNDIKNTQEDSLRYVDSNFLSISKEEEENLISEILNKITQSEEEIIEWILDN